MVNGTLPQDRRALILRWIGEQEALCEKAQPGPWMTGRAGGIGVVSYNGDDINLIAGISHDGSRALIAASRSVLPLALAALRAEVEAHPAAANGNWCNGEPCMSLGVHADECPTIDRLFCSLGLQDSGR